MTTPRKLTTPIGAEEFAARFGHVPRYDDLDRVNCPKAGEPMHSQCGVCAVHDRPRFECLCPAATPSAREAQP